MELTSNVIILFNFENPYLFLNNLKLISATLHTDTTEDDAAVSFPYCLRFCNADKLTSPLKFSDSHHM